MLEKSIALFLENKKWFLISMFGLMLLGFGLLLFNSRIFESARVEILEAPSREPQGSVVVEISGSVMVPGVYELSLDSRVENLLILAGGLSAQADRDWVAKNLNRAAKLVDGQKIYIPSVGESVAARGVSGSAGQVIGVSAGQININTASQQELESLSGIGPARAQGIITNRPYSSVDELLSKKVIPNNVYQKIKEKLTY